jgi:molybdate transport system substrate-binding protein
MRNKHLAISVVLLIGFALIATLMGCVQRPLLSSPGSIPSNLSGVLSGKEIMVFAGSASKPALDRAAMAFEERTRAKVYVTYGGSGTVLSQMELSRSGDIYIPGSPDYLVKAEKKNVTDPDTTGILAYLVPAICVQPGNPKGIRSLSDMCKPGITIGIGNPKVVCVGLYAVEILDAAHLLADIRNNIVTETASCEATASLISLRSVDAIIGWSVFHEWDPDNIEVVNIEPEQIKRLAYIPAVISTYSGEKEAAGEFIGFLTSETGQAFFRQCGYQVTESEARRFAPNAQIGGEYTLPDSYRLLD